MDSDKGAKVPWNGAGIAKKLVLLFAVGSCIVTLIAQATSTSIEQKRTNSTGQKRTENFPPTPPGLATDSGPPAMFQAASASVEAFFSQEEIERAVAKQSGAWKQLSESEHKNSREDMAALYPRLVYLQSNGVIFPAHHIFWCKGLSPQGYTVGGTHGGYNFNREEIQNWLKSQPAIPKSALHGLRLCTLGDYKPSFLNLHTDDPRDSFFTSVQDPKLEDNMVMDLDLPRSDGYQLLWAMMLEPGNCFFKEYVWVIDPSDSGKFSESSLAEACLAHGRKVLYHNFWEALPSLLDALAYSANEKPHNERIFKEASDLLDRIDAGPNGGKRQVGVKGLVGGNHRLAIESAMYGSRSKKLLPHIILGCRLEAMDGPHWEPYSEYTELVPQIITNDPPLNQQEATVASDALKVYISDIGQQLKTGYLDNKNQLSKKLKDATEQAKQIETRWHS
jgi:hypothetical protein